MRKLGDTDVFNKTVALRVDLNVPVKDGKVLDDTRILAITQTLNYLKQQKSKTVLISHFGRPEPGIHDEKLSLFPVAKRLEEIFYPNDPIPLYLNKKSETLKVIQKMRNEAHRFAINFHRNKRSKKAMVSSFDEIPGVGEKTKILLLKKFKSFKNLTKISEEKLSEEVGKARAKKIKEFLKSKS